MHKPNALSEFELPDAYAIIVGHEGRVVRAILEMGPLCCRDFAIGAAGLMQPIA